MVPVDEIFALVTTAFSHDVSVHGHSPHELWFGQRVSDALEVTLDSDDIFPANSDSERAEAQSNFLDVRASGALMQERRRVGNVESMTGVV